jgi:chromosome segregation ATPase
VCVSFFKKTRYQPNKKARQAHTHGSKNPPMVGAQDDDELIFLREQLIERDLEIGELRESLDDSEHTILDLHMTKTMAEARLIESTKKLIESDKKLAEYDKKIGAIEQREHYLDLKEEDFAHYRSKMEKEVIQHDETYEQLVESDKKLTESESSLADYRVQVKCKNEELDGYNRFVNSLVGKNMEFEKKLATSEANLIACQGEVHAKRLAYGLLRKQLDEVEETRVKNYQELKAAVSDAMQAQEPVTKKKRQM